MYRARIERTHVGLSDEILYAFSSVASSTSKLSLGMAGRCCAYCIRIYVFLKVFIEGKK